MEMRHLCGKRQDKVAAEMLRSQPHVAFIAVTVTSRDDADVGEVRVDGDGLTGRRLKIGAGGGQRGVFAQLRREASCGAAAADNLHGRGRIARCQAILSPQYAGKLHRLRRRRM